DWHKAIEHARRLEVMTGDDEAPMIAQFYCELAERARQHGARAEAREYLRQAFECKPDCVRAFMLRTGSMPRPSTRWRRRSGPTAPSLPTSCRRCSTAMPACGRWTAPRPS